jgi:primosomal protein N' (replication factor Y)
MHRPRAGCPGLRRNLRRRAPTRAVARAARFVTLREEIVERDPFTAGTTGATGTTGTSIWSVDATIDASRALTTEQADALQRLTAWTEARKFKTALLQGVTGSGKTEIYLRLAAAVTAAGRRVLVLVPEIGLTPVVAGLFRARFGSRVAIQHSGLSVGERHDQWHRIRRGESAWLSARDPPCSRRSRTWA